MGLGSSKEEIRGESGQEGGNGLVVCSECGTDNMGGAELVELEGRGLGLE